MVTNGDVKSNLEDMGTFMPRMGGYMDTSGVPKIFGDRVQGKSKRRKKSTDEPQADEE